MCLIKYLYYYTWPRHIPEKKEKITINDHWNNSNEKKIAGICHICNKYSASLEVSNKICYRCFEDKYND